MDDIEKKARKNEEKQYQEFIKMRNQEKIQRQKEFGTKKGESYQVRQERLAMERRKKEEAEI